MMQRTPHRKEWQQTCIQILEWMTKLCLLLPVFLAGRQAGSMVFCIGTGLVLSLLCRREMGKVPDAGKRKLLDFYSDEKSARVRTAVCCMAGWLCYLVTAAVFLYVGGLFLHIYFFPNLPAAVLVLLFVLAGVYLKPHCEADSILTGQAAGDRLLEYSGQPWGRAAGIRRAVQGTGDGSQERSGQPWGRGEGRQQEKGEADSGQAEPGKDGRQERRRDSQWRYRDRGFAVLALASVALFGAALLFGGAEIEATVYGNAGINSHDQLAWGVYDVFACMAGILLPGLFQKINKEDGRNGTGDDGLQSGSSPGDEDIYWVKEKVDQIEDNRVSVNDLIYYGKRGEYLALVAGAAAAGILCVSMAFLWGPAGMEHFVLRMFQNSRASGIPEVHLGEWERFFALLLSAGVLAVVARTFYYMEKLEKKMAAGRIFGGGNREWQIKVSFCRWISPALACLLAVGFRDIISAFGYYRALNLYLLTPLLLFFCTAFRIRNPQKASSNGKTHFVCQYGKKGL